MPTTRRSTGCSVLNAVGYGRDESLKLNLVYNPVGPSLPPPQEGLAADYHRELDERFGIQFNELWTITNMPIKRWRDDLERQGKLDTYMQLLVDAYNPSTVDGLMCRHQIHIDSQGRLHDCDFNYALNLRVPGHEQEYLWDVYTQGALLAAGSPRTITVTAAPPAPAAAAAARSKPFSVATHSRFGAHRS